MTGRWRSTLLTAAALALIVALGLWLRLLPCLRDPGGVFVSDAAFHLRMTRAMIEHGRLPAIDSLADAPQGRAIGRLLPLGLYPRAGLFHHVAAAFGARDPVASARVFVALHGAFIAFAVFGAAWALFGRRDAALLAALVGVLLPAHLHRTHGFWFRYEPAGALFLTAQVAFALGALGARGPRIRMALAIGSAVFLFAALWTWRVSFMVPILETGFVLIWALLRPPSAPLRLWFTVLVLACTIACLGLGYLREQAFALSRGWLLAMTLVLALWTPWLRRTDAGFGRRAAALGLGAAVAFFLGGLAFHQRQYAQVLDAAVRKIALTLGQPLGAAAPLTRLALNVEELTGSSWSELLGPGGLSWLGPWFLVCPLVLWLAAGRPSARRLSELPDAAALFGFLALALAGITLLFTRNKVVLAPMAAIAIGALVPALLPTRARSRPEPAAEARKRQRGRRAAAAPGRTRWASLAALGLLLLCVALTARDAVLLAVTRTSRLDPDLARALEWLRQETPPGAIVLSTWERGYEIQTYAGRRTLTDGLLEDPVDQQRIVGIARAWMQPAPDSLAAWCALSGAGYVLVPPSNYLHAIAVLTDWPSTWKVGEGIPLRPEEADALLVRMMVLGESPAPFEKAFESGSWRIYRVGHRALP